MKLKRILIGILFLFGISCGFVSRLSTIATPTHASDPLIPITGANPAPLTATPPFVPPGCAGQPVATLPAATLESQPTPSNVGTNVPLSMDEQLAVFNQIINLIPDLYVYPNLNGLNWPITVTKYQALIESGLDTESFYTQMSNMIGELRDNHSQYESPAQVAQANAALSGVNNYAGIGVEVEAVPKDNVLTVLLDFPDSSAEHAGLKPHDNLLAVDGIPLVHNGIARSEMIRGPVCSAAVLTVQTPGEKPRSVTVIRYNVQSYVPIVSHLVATKDGSRIGYIYLPSFFDDTLPGQVKQALQNFGPLDGLIIDNRMNPGGSSSVVEPILSYFTDGLLGHFVSRTDSNDFTVSADPVGNSQTVPLVILVGKDTHSFGEIFTGILQDIGRAKVVGENTPGNVEILSSHMFSDGARLWLAQARFVELHSTADWEQTGIIPDVQASAGWDTFTFANDPSVAAALKLLGHK